MIPILPVVAALVLGAAPAPGLAQEPAPATPPEARFRVHLVTIDQGDEVWEMFGHNALVVEDRVTGEANAWNWGLFDFEDVDFLSRFLRGTMLYWMAGMDPEGMIQAYIRANRSVYLHEVLLTPDEARALQDHVEWHSLPENRRYVYDYFRDNCSTRVRDALDLALGGLLRDRFEERETPHSYRWHSRRLVQGVGWVDQGLSFLLGPRGDRPITDWEAMFLPMEMADLLEEFERPWPDGEVRPLLGPREVLFEAERAPTPEAAPPFSIHMPVAGVLGAGLLLLLGWWAGGGARGGVGGPGTRTLFGAAVAGWALFSGLLGWILVGAWFTDHDFIHWNVNVLYTSPLAPLAFALLVPALTSRERAASGWGWWAARLSLVVAGLSLFAALLQALGLVRQGNGEVVAVALPLNLALALALVRLHREAREEPDDTPPDPAEAVAQAA